MPGKDILSCHFPKVPASDILQLEGIANRDSIPYAGTYDLGPIEELRTVLRGTLRYFQNYMSVFSTYLPNF